MSIIDPSVFLSGVDRYIHGFSRSAEVRYSVCARAGKEEMIIWEQQNQCALPADLKDFYQTTNGLTLSWQWGRDSNADGGVSRALYSGEVRVHALSELRRVEVRMSESSADTSVACLLQQTVADDEGGADMGAERPTLDARTRAFLLSPVFGAPGAWLCLVYCNVRPVGPAVTCGIWLLDRSLRWFPICRRFVDFHRLACLHLGLPAWPCLYSDIGLSPDLIRVYERLAPHLLFVDDTKTLVQRPTVTPNFAKLFSRNESVSVDVKTTNKTK